MSIGSVVTRGFGTPGSIALVVTRGFTLGEAVEDELDEYAQQGFPPRDFYTPRS